MGNYKYLLTLPFVAVVASGRDDADHWALHMCCIAAVRYFLAQCFITASRVNRISGKHRIQSRGVSFEQMDREENWDDYILLQMYVMTAVHAVLPGFRSFPAFDGAGLWKMALLHMGPTEFIYYWFHRALHHHSLFASYHSHHHKSFVTEPVSGTCHPFLETVGYTANFAVPMLGTWLCGAAPLLGAHAGGCSLAMFYTYTACFDVLNMVGHCNWEFVPARAYQALPFLKYLIYTPSYHSLHHSRVHTNFCLFMPIYDYWFGTLERERENPDQWTSLKVQAAARRRAAPDPPACVFLAHGTDLLSATHLPFWFRGFSSRPYKYHWSLLPLWPLAAAACALLWVGGRVFVSHTERVGGEPVHTWVTPRFGFQYFMGAAERARINRLIAAAIADADKLGVRVFGLGALNKAEHLNGGGAIFPPLLEKQLPQGLRTRVVHGNTLTAACLLAELAPGCTEVFLTGATSKLGRAAALYLCRKGVRVLMLTSAADRFEAIKAEAAPEHRALLVRVRDHTAGAQCSTWIVAKPCGAAEQASAPPGAHFHQVVVPPMERLRTDCSYGELAAMDLPPSATDTRACELFMPRRRVFACHAGALTHMLCRWTHHEVGAIAVDRIDATLEAALALGFRPAMDGWPAAAQRAAHAALAWSETVAAAKKAQQEQELQPPGGLSPSLSDYFQSEAAGEVGYGGALRGTPPLPAAASLALAPPVPRSSLALGTPAKLRAALAALHGPTSSNGSSTSNGPLPAETSSAAEDSFTTAAAAAASPVAAASRVWKKRPASPAPSPANPKLAKA